jgi:hypothetical protein
MTDERPRSPAPLEDASDPPTSMVQSPTTEEEAATQEAGGEVVARERDGELDIEGPNSA